MSDRPPAVLFLCTHNAGRSQMAMGWARHPGGDGIGVYSGGSEPASSVNPAAVAAMAEKGIDISGAQPQRWTREQVEVCDAIVNMGCGDQCPVLPGKRYLDWQLDDPAGQGWTPSDLSGMTSSDGSVNCSTSRVWRARADRFTSRWKLLKAGVS